ncbi:MAG: type II toxin-antitoxin system RelE/ParE family toxin [Hormoscilla sp. GUM202]|nr:type II toxin-antitoxin system RelE/ParE family toxin [Hormoscilla sp. GUM202]
MQTEPPEPPAVEIYFSPEFKKKLGALAKKYRNVRSDIHTVLSQLQVGEFVGDRISGVGEDYVVFKVRIKNSNIPKGKSAGYRLIYQVESSTSVLLLSIYSKSDQQDIALSDIRSILAEFYRDD